MANKKSTVLTIDNSPKVITIEQEDNVILYNPIERISIFVDEESKVVKSQSSKTSVITEENKADLKIIKSDSKRVLTEENENKVIMVPSGSVKIFAEQESTIINNKDKKGNIISVGQQGIPGPKGDDGAKGEKGEKGDPGNFDIDDFNEYIDLSSQIDEVGANKNFSVGKPYRNLRVFYNGRLQNGCIVSQDEALGIFEVDFLPLDGKHLAVIIDNP